VERKVGDWDFAAHDFSEDELVYAAYKILSHAMTMPEVGYLRLTDGMIFLPLDHGLN
jgi:3',5'-cyclic-nucleotide phosphodiesterase